MTTATVTNKHGVEVGDIFVGSWGYDQTNVDAWQATGVTKASVKLVKIATEVVGNRVRPVRDVFLATKWQRDENGLTVRDDYGLPLATIETIVKRTNDRQVLSMASYMNAYKWDGEATFHETFASGGAGH